MTIPLRQSTAGQEIPLGYFVDSADGNTEETGLTIANTDIKLWKNGATTLANKNSSGATHISNGIYYAVLDATDTNTLGALRVFTHVSGALPVKVDCVVYPATIYDSVIAGTDLLQSDLTQIAGAAVSTSTAQLGVNVVNVGGSAVSQSGGLLNANVTQISGDATAADNAEAFFDGTGYAGTNNVIPTVTAVGSVTGNVGGNVAGSVGSVTGGINTSGGTITTLDALDTAQDTQHGTTQSAIAALNDVSTADVNAQVDIALADYDAPTYNELLNLIRILARKDSAIASDLTSLLTSLNADLGSGAGAYSNTTDSIEAIRDRGDSAWVTAAGTSTLTQADIRTAVGLASANLDTQLTAIDDYLDTEVAAIKAKTDQLTFTVANQIDANALSVSGDGTVADRLELWTDGFVTGTAQTGDVDFIRLASGESSQDDIYYGYTLRIVSGTGAGQTASITQYTGVTRSAEVFPLFTTTPDNTSVYLLMPNGVVQADVNGIRHDNQRAADLSDLMSGYNTDGYVPASVLSLNGNNAAAANLEADYDGTGYDKSTSTVGTATNVLNLGGVDPSTLINELLYPYIAILARKDTAIATDFASILTTINADYGSGGGTYANTTDALEAIRDRGDAAWVTGTTPPTAADIADAVWDETLADHLTAGSTGNALNAAGSAGDPWATALPGAYGSGTAGKIIGDNINATISSRASQTSVDTIDDFLDTEIAAILADTNELQADWADGGRLDLILDSRASQSSLDTLDNFVDTEVAAILEDTGTTLPAQIAALSIPTAAQNADAVWDEARAGHTTNGTFGQFTPADVVSWDGDATYISALNLIMEMYLAESYVNANLKSIGDVDLVTGTAQTGSSSSIRLAAGESSVASVYVGYLVLITSGTGAKQLRYINGYNGTTKDASVTPAYATNPDNTSVYLLIPTGLAGADILAILSDENAAQNLQNVVAEYGNEGYLPANVTGWNSSPVATPDTAGYPVVTVKDGTGQGEISITSGRVGVNLDDTAGTLAKGTDITGFNDLDAAGIRTSVGLASANLDTQLTAIDDFLDTEIAAIKAKTDNLPTDPADQSAVEAAITAATSGLATAANLATLTAYVDTEVAAILEDTATTIPAQIAALNNLSAAQVNTEVDTALTDIHLDHLFATDYDPANKPGVSTALLNELVESDGGVSRYTANALENAPSGGSGGATAAQVWAYGNRTLTSAVTSVETTVSSTEVSMYRGDTFGASMTGLGALGTWSKVYLTVKRDDSRDEESLVQLLVTNPAAAGDGLQRLNGRTATAAWGSLTIDDDSAGDITIALSANATKALEPGDYLFDIKYINSTGSHIKASGTWIVNQDITRAIA